MNQNFTNNELAVMHFTYGKPMEMQGRQNGFNKKSIQTAISKIENYL